MVKQTSNKNASVMKSSKLRNPTNNQLNLLSKQQKKALQKFSMSIEGASDNAVLTNLANYVTTVHGESNKWQNVQHSNDSSTETQLSHSAIKANRKNIKSVEQLIKDADVIIEVLDARHPDKFRSTELEDLVLKENKKLVLVLTKVDLVTSTTAVDKWVNYYKKFAPTVTFKSTISTSRSKNSRSNFVSGEAHKINTSLLQQANSVLGAQDLLKLLQNYTRTDKNIECAVVNDITDGDDVTPGATSDSQFYKNIKVAIVGLPNVGKSSIINSLKRNTCFVKTGNLHGLTKSINEIKLTKRITLVDTPGIIVNKMNLDAAILLNAASSDDPDDNFNAVRLMLATYEVRDTIMSALNLQLPPNYSADDLCCAVCDKYNFFSKGAARNFLAASKFILAKWNDSTINHYDLPINTITNDFEIVTPSEPLDLDSILDNAKIH